MQQRYPTVGIIGGGIAGLYTAYLLTKKGIPFELFEAKSFVGGRIYGESTHSSDYKIDLGPSWIFPHQRKIQELVKYLGLSLTEQYSFGDALFQRTANERAQKISGVAPAPMYRVSGGTTRLIQVIVDSLDQQRLHVEMAASSIQFDGTRWRLRFTNHTEIKEFEHLVLALPPRLVTDKLAFTESYTKSCIHSLTIDNETSAKAIDPVNSLANLLNKFTQTPTWMAAQAKFAVTYETPFWREQGLSGQAFSHSGPMVEIHDASFESRGSSPVFALFGFIGLPVAHRLQLSDSELEMVCLAQLRSLFGAGAGNYKQTFMKDWAKDSATATGRDQAQASQHPFIDVNSEQTWLTTINLYLAGSEFAENEAGYIEGAIIASEKTVNEISHALQ